MLKWAIIFFIVSIIAGLFGFRGVAGLSRTIARVLFFIFVVGFVIFLILGLIAL